MQRLTRRHFIVCSCSPIALAFAGRTAGTEQTSTATYADYVRSWQKLRDGALIDPSNLKSLLNDAGEFDYRIGEYGVDKMWGVFASCAPHKDVLYDFLSSELHKITDPLENSLPAPFERGQVYAWSWTYWGRAALYLWLGTGEERFRNIFIKAARTIMRARDDFHGRKDTIQKRVVKSWGAAFVVDGVPERVTDITATGLIALPFLIFANSLKHGDPVFHEFSSCSCPRRIGMGI